jgi:LysM repeat protein
VRDGDNLSSIASQFDIPLEALIMWNRIELNNVLHPGDRLIIFPKQKNN